MRFSDHSENLWLIIACMGHLESLLAPCDLDDWHPKLGKCASDFRDRFRNRRPN